MSRSAEWVEFFHSAGIPPDSAAMYAVNFVENRITKNMLLDLNKEYLKELGVKALGDVIAILKKSQEVHDQLAKDKLLSSNQNTNRRVIATNATKQLSTGKSQTVVPSSTSVNSRASVVAPTSFRPSTSSNAKVETVSSRLGPPNEIRFSDRGLGPSNVPSRSSSSFAEKRKKITFDDEKASSASHSKNFESSSVFQRLGDERQSGSLAGQSKQSVSAFARLGEESHKPRSTSFEEGNFRSRSERPSSLSAMDLSHQSSRPTERRKKLVMIKTYKDGSKVKEVISRDDPILRQVEVKKVSRRQPTPSISMSDRVIRPVRVGTLKSDDLLPREPKKRQRITGPSDSPPRNSRPQRLSPEPIPKKRIAAPGSDFILKNRISTVKDRLGPKY